MGFLEKNGKDSELKHDKPPQEILEDEKEMTEKEREKQKQIQSSVVANFLLAANEDLKIPNVFFI